MLLGAPFADALVVHRSIEIRQFLEMSDTPLHACDAR